MARVVHSDGRHHPRQAGIQKASRRPQRSPPPPQPRLARLPRYFSSYRRQPSYVPKTGHTNVVFAEI